LWFGTDAGAAVYDGASWAAFRAASLGLASEQVRALAVDRAGRVYAGTPAGAAVWDGRAWTALQMGHGDEASILAEAATSAPGGEAVWFGTLAGLKRLDTATGGWQIFARSEIGLSLGGIAALATDSRGRLWAGSLGSGVSVFDGTDWTQYRLDNSGLANSEVNVIAELQPGLMWLGTAAPTAVGGTLASFDGQKWHSYEPKNSGFSGAEPLAIAIDNRGQVWVGTRTAGLDIYQLNR
jgi:ligand-binding sensor domain-containing protein